MTHWTTRPWTVLGLAAAVGTLTSVVGWVLWEYGGGPFDPIYGVLQYLHLSPVVDVVSRGNLNIDGLGSSSSSYNVITVDAVLGQAVLDSVIAYAAIVALILSFRALRREGGRS